MPKRLQREFLGGESPMQIDRTDGYPTPGVPDPAVRPLGQAHTTITRRADRQAADQADLSVENLISKAAETPDVRPEAVAEAKQRLESGTLDTFEAIRRAAEAIITRGI